MIWPTPTMIGNSDATQSSLVARLPRGRHVTLAARIASQATGGQILTSSLLKELTDTSGDIEFDGGKEIELKGLTGTQRVYAIGW